MHRAATTGFGSGFRVMERALPSVCKAGGEVGTCRLEPKREFQEGTSIVAQWHAVSSVRKFAVPLGNLPPCLVCLRVLCAMFAAS